MPGAAKSFAAVATAVLIFGLPSLGAAEEQDTRGTKQAGDLLVRGKALAVVPDGGGTTKQLGGDLDVNTSFGPSLDFTYFITKNIGIELVLATTRHEVTLKNSSAGADVDLGKVQVVPPVISLQYHFLTDEIVSPYVGVGLNYSIFFDETDGPTATDVRIDNAFGYAFGAGIDFQFPYSNFVFNMDAKKVFVSPSAKARVGATTVKSRNFDLDPWVVGIGFGYKF